MSSDNSGPNEGLSILDLAPRPRRSTLETFNEELAILDRPIEVEVEYYDEAPPKRRFGMGAIAAALLLLAGGGFLTLSGHRTAVLALVRRAQAVVHPTPSAAPAAAVASASPATAPTATATMPTATVVVAPMAPAAPTAAPGIPTPTGGSAKVDDAAPTSRAPRAALANNGGRSRHHRHGHPTGHRSSRRHGRQRA